MKKFGCHLPPGRDLSLHRQPLTRSGPTGRDDDACHDAAGGRQIVVRLVVSVSTELPE